MTTLFSPIFTAEARALADLWTEEQPMSGNGAVSARWRTLLKAMLPDVLETPERLKRVWDGAWEWLGAQPRSIQEGEQVRQELLDIFVAQQQHLDRFLQASQSLGMPADNIRELLLVQDKVATLHKSVFDRWRPFTDQDRREALAEIRQGEVHDVEDLIRELQSRRQ